jgi:purine-nucleoside phosphorylase
VRAPRPHLVSAELLSRLDGAAAAVRRRAPRPPEVGVVLGSGLGGFADTLEEAVVIPFAEIPHVPRPTVEGHAGALALGRSGDVAVVALKGRIHFYEAGSLEDVVFPVRLLGRLGVRTLILTNAAGAINPAFRAGDLMILRDHINFLGNPLVGPNLAELGPRFPDMTEAYDPGLREVAARACAAAGVSAREGVYIAVSGPSYETPAEIRMARTVGADAVGMSTVPEVIAARHLGMRVLALSCLTNPAAGVSARPLDHADVLAVAESLRGALLDVLTRVVAEVSRTP